MTDEDNAKYSGYTWHPENEEQQDFDHVEALHQQDQALANAPWIWQSIKATAAAKKAESEAWTSTKIIQPQGYTPEPTKNGIEIILGQAVEEGDPNGYAIQLFARKLYKGLSNFDISDEAANNAALHWGWDGTFGPYDEGTPLTVPYSRSTYIYGLKIMYGQRSPKVRDFIKGFVDIDKGSYLQNTDIDYLEKLSQLTEAEVEAFEQWCIATKHSQPFVLDSYKPDRSIKGDSLKRWIVDFSQEKGLEKMGEEKNSRSPYQNTIRDKDDDPTILEDYVRTGDEQKDLEFDQMLLLFAKVDPKLMQQYLKDDLSESKFIKHLGKADLKLKDLERFKSLYKYKALQNAFSLLAKSEELVSQEIERYQDEAQLKKLASIIKGKQPVFKGVRVDAAKFFSLLFSRYPYSLLNYQAKQNKEGKQKLDFFNQMLASLDEETRDLFKTLVRGNGLVNLRQLEFPKLVRLGAITAAYMSTYDDVVNPPDKLEFAPMAKIIARGNALNADLSSQGEANNFLVLRDATFDYSQLANFTEEQIAQQITRKLQQKKENIATVREDLNSDPDYIWELQPLISYTAQNTQMLPNSAAGKIISDKTSDVAFYQNLKSIGLGALSLVLAVGGIFTGGVTTWVGGALIAGSVGLGAYDVYSEVRKYQKGSSVSDTAIQKAHELGNVSVNEWGIILSVAGLVLDVADLVKGIRLVAKATSFNKNARKAGRELYDQLKNKNRLRINVNEEEFIKRIETSMRETADLKQSKEFKKLLKMFDDGPVNEVTQLGLYRMSQQENTAKLIQQLSKHPDILRLMANNVIADIHNLALYERLATICLDQSLDAATTMRWLVQGGRRYAHFLPGVLDTLKDEIVELPKELLEGILSRPKLMGLVIAHAEKPDTLRNAYEAWRKTNPDKSMAVFEQRVGQMPEFKRFFKNNLDTVATVRQVDDLTEASFRANRITRDEQANLVAKLLKGQIDVSDIRWLNEALTNPQLDDAALDVIKVKISKEQHHVKAFVERVSERMRSQGLDLSEAIQYAKGQESVEQALKELNIDFSSLRGARAQNLAVYGTSEKNLAELLNSPNVGNYLPQDVITKLEGILGKDQGMTATTKLANVREPLVKQINELLGSHLSIDEIRKLDSIGIPGQQGSRGSVLEHWVATNAPNQAVFKGKTLQGGKKFDYLYQGKTERVLLDNYYEKGSIVAVEVKNVSAKFGAHPKHQLKRYAAMVADGTLKRVEYIFESEKVAGLNEDLIIKAFEDLYLKPRQYKIYYIDDLGQIQPL